METSFSYKTGDDGEWINAEDIQDAPETGQVGMIGQPDIAGLIGKGETGIRQELPPQALKGFEVVDKDDNKVQTPYQSSIGEENMPERQADNPEQPRRKTTGFTNLENLFQDFGEVELPEIPDTKKPPEKPKNKMIYWVIAGVIIAVIGFLIYNYYQNTDK